MKNVIEFLTEYIWKNGFEKLSENPFAVYKAMVNHLATDKRRNRKTGFWGILGIISLKMSDLFTKKDIMTDDEVEDIIRSVRKRSYAGI